MRASLWDFEVSHRFGKTAQLFYVFPGPLYKVPLFLMRGFGLFNETTVGEQNHLTAEK